MIFQIITKVGRRIILVITSILLTFVLFEIGLQIWHQQNLNKTLPFKNLALDKTIESEIRNITKDLDLKNSFVIYYLGGSTMEGYQSNLTIPALVESFLIDKKSTKPFVSVNLGKSGARLEYQLEIIKILTAKKQEFNPALIIIYTGHNEFATRYSGLGLTSNSENDAISSLINSSYLLQANFSIFKKYKLDIDERKFFDVPYFSDSEKEKILSDFKSTLNQSSSILTDANIPVIYITQIANYSDWGPNRSIFCKDKESQKQEFLKLISAAELEEKNNNLERALNIYKSALIICPQFADVHFRLGNIYRRQNNSKAAWDSYRLAIDYDGLPISAVSTINNALKTQSSKKGVYVVDAENYLRINSPNQLVGYNLMIDGHHPNADGYRLIAKAVASQITDIFPYKFDQELNLQKIYTENINISDENYLNKADWLIQMSTWRYNPEIRSERAKLYFNNILRKDPKSWRSYLGLALLQFLEKDKTGGLEYLRQAKKIDEKSVDNALQTGWILEIMIRAFKNDPDA